MPDGSEAQIFASTKPAGARAPDRSAQFSAEEVLGQLGAAFVSLQHARPSVEQVPRKGVEPAVPDREPMYRALVEQIPAVVFITYLDKGTTEAYVSPHIESALGFTQEEWLDDPVRWYEQIHPADKARWNIEAAETLATGKPLKSSYRVLARDGKVLWFRCEAKMVRHPDGRPWFILGVGFDITDLKRTEEALQERTQALRNLSANLLQLQDKERRRLARELHDGVGQYLAALKLNLDLLASSASDENGSLWAEAERLLERCLSETRSMAYLLHPPVLEDAGLASTISWYIKGFIQRSGLDIKLNLPTNMPRLHSSIELAIYRVLQESLTNVLRHSGSKIVRITLVFGNGEIALEVKDSGRGMPGEILQKFNETGSHVGVGLAGMRERAAELAGRLEVRSGDTGTLIRLTLPVRGAADALGDNLANVTDKT